MKRYILVIQIGLVIAFFGSWELCAQTGLINPDWFSPPSGILMRSATELVSAKLLHHSWVTAVETLSGFAAGVVGGVALGIVLGLCHRLREILMPYLMAIYGIPRPALAPVFVLWFGIGMTSKIVLIISLVYFTVLIYMIGGFRSVNPDLLRLASTVGASRMQLLVKILIPSVMPWIFAGMKLGIGLAIIGAVVGEIISSEAGLGFYILQSSDSSDTEGIYVGLTLLGVMSWLFVDIMERIDRRLFHWRQEAAF